MNSALIRQQKTDPTDLEMEEHIVFVCTLCTFVLLLELQNNFKRHEQLHQAAHLARMGRVQPESVSLCIRAKLWLTSSKFQTKAEPRQGSNALTLTLKQDSDGQV